MGNMDGKKFVLFHWKNCGHCKKMKPEWEKLENGQYGKYCKKYESKEITQELSEKYLNL